MCVEKFTFTKSYAFNDAVMNWRDGIFTTCVKKKESQKQNKVANKGTS